MLHETLRSTHGSLQEPDRENNDFSLVGSVFPRRSFEPLGSTGLRGAGALQAGYLSSRTLLSQFSPWDSLPLGGQLASCRAVRPPTRNTDNNQHHLKLSQMIHEDRHLFSFGL